VIELPLPLYPSSLKERVYFSEAGNVSNIIDSDFIPDLSAGCKLLSGVCQVF